MSASFGKIAGALIENLLSEQIDNLFSPKPCDHDGHLRRKRDGQGRPLICDRCGVTVGSWLYIKGE